MAGAGKKTFVAGEVLTAAQVNDYLMDQAVMRFSGSAARAASITAPTEGMLTYLDDVDRVEFYDGSSWQQVYPSSSVNASIASRIAASAFTAKGQILVASANAAPIAVSIGGEGQVLTAASAQTSGVQWVTPQGAGKAAYKNIAATGVTSLPSTLTPGFYRISTGNTNSWTQTEFRFVDQYGDLYGVAITSGVGFTTIPVSVASVNITVNAGFNLLVEELPGITQTLPTAPTVTGFGWTNLTGGSITFNAVAASINAVGYFDPTSGSFYSSGTTTSPFSTASIAASTAALSSDHRFTFVSRNTDGLWSTSGSAWSASALGTLYPFQLFTANGTYTPPSWSSSVDVLVVSGGGAGGGVNTAQQIAGSGGGGAGGASLFTNVATPASVSVTVGSGGTGGLGSGPNGSTTSFGARSTSGGGGGGYLAAGASGGSGGGGGGRSQSPLGDLAPAGGSGTAGQGNNGGNSLASGPGVAGGGGGGVNGTGGAGLSPSGANAVGGTGGIGTTQWGYSYGGGGGGGAVAVSGGTGGSATNGGGGGGATTTGLPAPGNSAGGGSGTANTGGGGGGASYFDTNAPISTAGANGGSGGSGFVLVRAR